MMTLEEGLKAAQEAVDVIAPYCDRVVIAGSIRRRCPAVNDLEIVCIPRVEGGGFFGDIPTRSPEFVEAVNAWPAIRGKAEDGRYTRRIMPAGEELDLFITDPDRWGLILAIRTGSAEFSRRVLAGGWTSRGYHSDGGVLYDSAGHPTYIREEEHLFTLLGIPWVDPWLREI